MKFLFAFIGIDRGMERLSEEYYAGFPRLGSYSVEPENFIFVKK